MNLTSIINKYTKETKELYDAIRDIPVYFDHIADNFILCSRGNKAKDNFIEYTLEGKDITFPNGIVALRPSKDLTWEKLTWEKGEVLHDTTNDNYMIFKQWDKKYKTAKVAYVWNPKDLLGLNIKNHDCYLMDYCETSDLSKFCSYKNKIEILKGGLFNKEAEIIKFKKGDFITIQTSNNKYIGIYELDDKDTFTLTVWFNKTKFTELHSFLSINKEDILFVREIKKDEKDYLLSLLEKNNLTYDEKTKEVKNKISEPKKEKWIPKPYEKVLVRDLYSYPWRPDIFRYMKKDVNNLTRYYTCSGFYYQCIPYEGNEDKVNNTDCK